MTLQRRLLRGLGGILGTVGLAYPACAAVCPRGEGACPYPGRCFLYTDADTNSLCDYTSRSTATSGTGSTASTGTPSVTSAPDTASSVSTLPASSDPGVFSVIPSSVLLTGAVVFAVLCAVLFYAFRSGVAGIRIPKTGAALAASSLLALGLSGMVTFILAGDGASASTFALVYLLAGTPLAAYVWKSGCLSRTLAAAAAVMSVAFGFIVGAPLMPAEFVGLVGLATLGQTLTPGIVGILAGIGLVLVVGRTFCGQLCPVGSVQELAWSAPVRKIDLRRTKYLEAFRLVVFAASVTAALSLINLMAYTGVSDFFSLALTAGSIIFIALLALSAVFYRPVCRGLCPFGLLFSLPAQFSLYRLRRTDACVDCGKCEKACPVHAAGRDASKRECYLCARCTDACPVSGALAYGNRYG